MYKKRMVELKNEIKEIESYLRKLEIRSMSDDIDTFELMMVDLEIEAMSDWIGFLEDEYWDLWGMEQCDLDKNLVDHEGTFGVTIRG